MRNAEVIRQWRILKRIEAGRYTTARDLAEEHGVTERTIRRDLGGTPRGGLPALRRAGRGSQDLAPDRRLQAAAEPELHPVRAGRALLRQEPDVVPGAAPRSPRDLESAFEKIREALPSRSLPYLDRIQRLFATRPDPFKDYSEKQEVIAAVIEATLHQQQARIDYFSFTSRRVKSYTLDPYRVVYHHGGLYLYARAHEYDEVRTFAVERIERIELLDANFEIPPDFDVEAYARGAFGIAGGEPVDVEIEFDSDVTSYIRERIWHESQTLEDAARGGVVLRLSVAPSEELKSWIKGFIPHVRVLKPKRLAAEIGEELERARKAFPAPGRRSAPKS